MVQELPYKVFLQLISEEKPKLIASFSSDLNALIFASDVARKGAGYIVSLYVESPLCRIVDLTENNNS